MNAQMPRLAGFAAGRGLPFAAADATDPGPRKATDGECWPLPGSPWGAMTPFTGTPIR